MRGTLLVAGGVMLGWAAARQSVGHLALAGIVALLAWLHDEDL